MCILRGLSGLAPCRRATVRVRVRRLINERQPFRNPRFLIGGDCAASSAETAEGNFGLLTTSVQTNFGHERNLVANILILK